MLVQKTVTAAKPRGEPALLCLRQFSCTPESHHICFALVLLNIQLLAVP